MKIKQETIAKRASVLKTLFVLRYSGIKSKDLMSCLNSNSVAHAFRAALIKNKLLVFNDQSKKFNINLPNNISDNDFLELASVIYKTESEISKKYAMAHNERNRLNRQENKIILNTNDMSEVLTELRKITKFLNIS